MNFQIVNQRLFRSGGNGNLFIGERSDTHESVMVKCLREYHLPHARKAFAREVRVLARKLRGLVPLLGWDTDAEHPYYVMPYLNGGTLTQYAGRLTDIQLRNIAAELGWTLANLHATNEAHGDVKPDNILVAHDGRLQIADPLGNGSIFTMLFSDNRGGTPGYCAPEICAGGSISRVADVFSYGATMYHLYTGRRPQDGQRPYLGPEDYARAPKICEIISTCCQLEPHSRPIMQEVLRMLHGARWADIQAERKQRRELVTSACFVGCLVIVAVALARSSRGMQAATA
jgi:serine/threonine protein kinase